MSEDTVLVRPTRTGSPTAVGSPPRLNKRDAVVTAVDPLSAIAHSSASRRPWASARRRDDGDGDGRLDAVVAAVDADASTLPPRARGSCPERLMAMTAPVAGRQSPPPTPPPLVLIFAERLDARQR